MHFKGIFLIMTNLVSFIHATLITDVHITNVK